MLSIITLRKQNVIITFIMDRIYNNACESLEVYACVFIKQY